MQICFAAQVEAEKGISVTVKDLETLMLDDDSIFRTLKVYLLA